MFTHTTMIYVKKSCDGTPEVLWLLNGKMGAFLIYSPYGLFVILALLLSVYFLLDVMMHLMG